MPTARVVATHSLAPPLASRPLLAVGPSGLLAASTSGRIVHLVRADELLASWRLPAPPLLLHWVDAADAALAGVLVVVADGSAWLVGARQRGLSPAVRKRSREDEPAAPSRRAVCVGDEERVPMPPLGQLESACIVSGGLVVWASDGSASHVSLPPSLLRGTAAAEAVSPAAAAPPTARTCPRLGGHAAPLVACVHPGPPPAANERCPAGCARVAPSLHHALAPTAPAASTRASTPSEPSSPAPRIVAVDRGGALHSFSWPEALGGEADQDALPTPIARLNEPPVALLLARSRAEPEEEADTVRRRSRRSSASRQSFGEVR